MTKKLTGLEPRGFRWVIKGRLAVAERIGGYGFQHRKVRREEEIIWLQDHDINTIVSLLGANQNSAAYEEAGLRFIAYEVADELEPEEATEVFEVLASALEDEEAVALVHRDTIDDMMGGILAGFLIHSGLVEDPIIATDVIQRILGRAIGPEGRRLVPQS